MKVVPAIDIRGGRCVRLLRGEFEQETEYNPNPAEVAAQFVRLGVADLHIVDLDGARDGQQQNQPTVQAIADASHLCIQLGGGIRSRETISSWLQRGVSRCVIGSMAVTKPRAVLSWIDEFGPERIVLALDVRLADDGEPLLSTHGWKKTSGVSLWDCIDTYRTSGLRHVLCTDVSRDGAMQGPNTALYEEFVKRFPDVELQASGGVRGVADLQALRKLGAASAITGRALLDGALTSEEVRSFQQSA